MRRIQEEQVHTDDMHGNTPWVTLTVFLSDLEVPEKILHVFSL